MFDSLIHTVTTSRGYNPPPKAPLQVKCRHRNNIGHINLSLKLRKSSIQHMSFLRLAPLRPFAAIRTFTTTTRIMAPKQEWMVILPDYSGKLAERNQVRAYV